jgi:hypothetical protein
VILRCRTPETQSRRSNLDVVTANALTGTSDSFELILTVGLLPPDEEKVAILHMPKDQAGGPT